MTATTMTPEQLKTLTGYRQGKRQCAWVRRELGLQPAVGADGHPRLTMDVVNAALLQRNGLASLPSRSTAAGGEQPRWSR